MPSAVRILRIVSAAALALGLIVGAPLAIWSGVSTPEIPAPAPSFSPALLPPLEIAPIAFAEPVAPDDRSGTTSPADERMERLERSVVRLAGLMEDQNASANAASDPSSSAPAIATAPMPAPWPRSDRFAQAQPPAAPLAAPLPSDPRDLIESLPPGALGDLAPLNGFDPRRTELAPSTIADPMDPVAPYGPAPFSPLPGPSEAIELETSREIALSELIHLLGQGAGFNVVVAPSVEGNVSASLRNVSGLDALTALLRAHGYILRRDGDFLFVGKPGDFSEMERLDDRVHHRVYRPRFVTALELQTLLAPIMSETGRMTVTRAAEVGIAPSNDMTGGDAYAGEEILLVRDWESNLQQTDAVVADVDRMPLQAAIEAVILSVELDDEHRCGVNLDLLRGVNETRIVSGTPDTTTLATMDISDGGLNIGFLSAHVGAFVEALEEIGDTQVVARPRVTCVNKQRAEILIGDQIGYLSTTQTETATTQTVEFLDVGTQLRIRPFIAPEGIIRLEVHPELSSGEVRLVGDTPLPEKSTTQVTTNILCRDGSTVVIGGLIREETISNTGQVPILGDIPYAGWLFRRNTESTRRTELIVLITPRILRDPLDGCDPTAGWEGLAERQTSLFNDRKLEFLKRMQHAKQYGRLAQTAYIAGNFEKAHRYANIALQFDAKDRTALSILGRLEMDGAVYAPNAVPPETLIAPTPAAYPQPPSLGTEIYSPPTSGPLSLGPPVAGDQGAYAQPAPAENYSYGIEGNPPPAVPPVIDVVPPPPQEFQP